MSLFLLGLVVVFVLAWVVAAALVPDGAADRWREPAGDQHSVPHAP